MKSFVQKRACHLMSWGLKIEQGLREIGAAGFAGCEVGSRELLQNSQDMPGFVDRIHEAGLQLSSVYAVAQFENFSFRRESFLHHERVAWLMEQAGAGLVVLGPGIGRTANPTWKDQKQMLYLIEEIWKRYEHHGIAVGLHPHVGSHFFTREQIDFVLENVSRPLSLVPDIGHLVEAGIDPIRFLQDYLPLVCNVHLKDVRFRQSFQKQEVSIKRLKTDFCELGCGELNLRGLLELLDQLGYEGWLTVEIENPIGSLADSAKSAMHFLQGERGGSG